MLSTKTVMCTFLEAENLVWVTFALTSSCLLLSQAILSSSPSLSSGSTLSICDDILLLCVKRIIPLLTSPMTKSHPTPRTHKVSPFEALSLISLNRVQETEMLRWPQVKLSFCYLCSALLTVGSLFSLFLPHEDHVADRPRQS